MKKKKMPKRKQYRGIKMAAIRAIGIQNHTKTFVNGPRKATQQVLNEND